MLSNKDISDSKIWRTKNTIRVILEDMSRQASEDEQQLSDLSLL